jgi:hypothetical protein
LKEPGNTIQAGYFFNSFNNSRQLPEHWGFRKSQGQGRHGRSSDQPDQKKSVTYQQVFILIQP